MKIFLVTCGSIAAAVQNTPTKFHRMLFPAADINPNIRQNYDEKTKLNKTKKQLKLRSRQTWF